MTTQVAANDINAAVDYIRGLRDVKQVYVLGHSWGTNTAGLFAMQPPISPDPSDKPRQWSFPR